MVYLYSVGNGLDHSVKLIVVLFKEGRVYMKKIYPSILSADFSKLGEEIKSIQSADGIHIDVMDGRFVDNITFGMPVVRDIRKCSDLFFDVHLMIEDPEKYVHRFAEAGADAITFHIEATSDPYQLINKIKELGKKVGISIKPKTPLPNADILKDIDIVLIMSVEPGFGGQKYIEEVNEKIEQLSKIRYENDLSFEIEIDGGINIDNIDKVAKCGVDVFVAGSAIFKEENREMAIVKLKNAIK